MNYLEMITHDSYNAYFVDLFVRASNELAISMYHNLGYIIYREVLGYYSGEENAYGKHFLVVMLVELYCNRLIFCQI